MGQYAVPLMIAVAVGLTYVCCVRPMQRHAGDASGSCCAPRRSDASTVNEIAALSEEIRALRESMADPARGGQLRDTRQADIPN